jgi:general nucleoside transport system permease protein
MSSFVISVLAMMPVFLIGTIGELISQKSGVYNIGIEGVMAFGAITGILSYNFIAANLLLSMIVGFLGGSLFGVINSFLSINLKLDQVVVGFGLWFLGVGLAGFIHTTFLAGRPPVQMFPKVLFSLDVVFYLSIALWVIVWVIFSSTSIGLRIKAVGEHPKSADVAGINVFRTRWVCVIVGCGLIGVAGAYLFMNFVQEFRTMVSGYGWMCFALVMFSRWKVPYTLVGTAIFTGINGIETRLQVSGVFIMPFQFMSVLAYVAVIVGLVITMATGGRGAMPSSLYVPYERE